MSDRRKSRFVADGRRRVIRGERKRIRREIRAKHAHELASAAFFRRFLIRYRIRREIGQALERIAPRGGLYVRKR